MLVMDEQRLQPWLQQTGLAEISSRRPVAEEGADTAPGSGGDLLVNALHRVQRSGAVSTQPQLLGHLRGAGPAGGARHLQALRRVTIDEIFLQADLAERFFGVSFNVGAVLLAIILHRVHDVL